MDLLGLNKLILDSCLLPDLPPASSRPGNTKMDLLGLDNLILDSSCYLTRLQPPHGPETPKWICWASTN